MPTDSAAPAPRKVPKPPTPHGGHITKDEFDAKKSVDLKSIESAVADFVYPIQNSAALAGHVERLERPFYFRGGKVDSSSFVHKLPAAAFPIKSASEFARLLEPYLKAAGSFAKKKANLPPTQSLRR